MSRRGWKTANISEPQAERIEQAVAAGYARNRDEFIRFWAEFGLITIGLLGKKADLSQVLAATRRFAEPESAHGDATKPKRG